MDEPDIERVLRYLGERLAFAGAPPTGLLVCGGAALIALHLGSRATRDVDVIAVIGRTEQMDAHLSRRQSPCRCTWLRRASRSPATSGCPLTG